MMKNKRQSPEECYYRLWVQEIAAQRSFSVHQLAHAAGLPIAPVQEISEKEISDVALSVLDSLARALGVSIHDLIEDIPELPQS